MVMLDVLKSSDLKFETNSALSLQETVQSLRFGEMCSAVEHEHAGSGKDAGVAVREALSRIDAEIKDLESQILQKEQWVWKKTTRLHVVDEMDDEMVVCNKDEEMELGGRGIRTSPWRMRIFGGFINGVSKIDG